MVVGDEIVCLSLVLEFEVLFDGAEVIAQVKFAGRLNPGKNAHGFDLPENTQKLPPDRQVILPAPLEFAKMVRKYTLLRRNEFFIKEETPSGKF